MTDSGAHWFFGSFPPMATPLPWEVEITDETLVHHLKTVMRARPGDPLVLVHPEQQRPYQAVVLELNKRSLQVRIEAALVSPPGPAVETLAAVALIKGQRWDWMLQKLTELGVSEIIPLQCQHSVVQTEGRSETKVTRWEQILQQAAEQSEQVRIPKIHAPCTPAQLIGSPIDAELKLVAVERSTEALQTILHREGPVNRVLYAIGPEGGWSEAERDIWTAGGFDPVSLGGTILRSETAALYLESVLQYAFSENRT